MPVLRNIGWLATCRDGPQEAIYPIEGAALVWQGEVICWVGKEADLPPIYHEEEVLDAGGRMVVPGLVDCHTHLAFGGWRADEFALRCRGVSYLDIARKGGGILRTVEDTRRATEEELLHRCKTFLQEMALLGTTTVEAKSGYGLSVEDELKLLRVYRRLNEQQPVQVVPTFLGAHTVPPEYREDRKGYMGLILKRMLPRIAFEELAEFCDVFVEETAFTLEEAQSILEHARSLGLKPKVHADQLKDGGGALLAARVKAVSADHLEYTGEAGIRALAKSGVVAVSLPLASLYLRQKPMEARYFIEQGVPVAVATDFNPGSAPSYHLPLAMTLACVLNGMTPAEALKGATRFAARAICREHEVGALEPGKLANFILVDAPDVNHWLYFYRPDAVRATFIRGRQIVEADFQGGTHGIT